MTVTKRQFTLLTAMGIELWQSRAHESPKITETATLNFAQLKVHPLFLDIIHSIGLSLGEIDVHQHHLSIGFANWQFSNTDQITYQDNLLTTPTLEQLASSTKLKRELWQTISQQACL